MDGKNRKDIKPGLRVHITQKQDQRTGKLTGGIKVRLTTGEVGRVQEIVGTSHTEKPDA
jgi:uncharacterized repeat protein (TIGR03833 family)